MEDRRIMYETIVKDTLAGKAAFLLPVVHDWLPDEVKEALSRRRTAALEGWCPCGEKGIQGTHRKGEVFQAAFEHQSDCPAADENVAPLLRKHGLKFA